jgi:cytochrome d ubiquinol oxidase subunit I
MSHLLAARAQMGTSLAFHIIFASLGIGLPLLIVIAEGLHLRTREPVYLALAKQWSKAFAILFAVGAVSGTVLSFELGLLWPRFMAYAGGIIGMPFSLEGFAFFIEAIFLGLYLYGWNRLSPRAHWLCGLPVAISGMISGVFVVTANAWMNAPAGFKIVDGKVTDVNPWRAMFNPAWFAETLHSTLAAYVAVGFAVAGIYAWGMLRGRRDTYHRRALLLALVVGGIAIPLQIVAGDIAARTVAHTQPVKLAAMESLFHTERGAPLRIGGIPDPATGTVRYAIEIPNGLSLLLHDDPNAAVPGLDQVPAADRPPVAVVHFAFDAMVGMGFFLLFAAGWFWWRAWRARRVPDGRWLLRVLVIASPLGFLAIEAGWSVTEVGRQPWVIYNVLHTADAVTTAPGLDLAFAGFTLLYIVLAATLIWLLLRIARGTRATAQTTAERALQEVA